MAAVFALGVICFGAQFSNVKQNKKEKRQKDSSVIYNCAAWHQ